MSASAGQSSVGPAGRLSDTCLAEFEVVYRAHVGAVTAFFSRRSPEPQIVADLTSETFAQAMGSFGTFDARKGSVRAWLLGIARHVYAQACARAAGDKDVAARLAGHRMLDEDEIEELAAKLDAQREGRSLLANLAVLSPAQRAAIEFVDIASLKPREAAIALGVSQGVLRARLFRARAQLRRKDQRHG